MPEVPATVEAGFAPLLGLDTGEYVALAEVALLQPESLHAQTAFERAVAAAVQGDEALAIAENLKASTIAESASIATVSPSMSSVRGRASPAPSPRPGVVPVSRTMLGREKDRCERYFGDWRIPRQRLLVPHGPFY